MGRRHGIYCGDSMLIRIKQRLQSIKNYAIIANRPYKDMREHPIYKKYFITEDGLVYSNISNKLKLMKQQKTYRGYYYIDLRIEKNKLRRYIHRLVAETYIDNPNNLPQVNHIDENKTNNCIGNLEWVTNQYNAEHSHSKYYKMKTPTGDIIEVFNLRKFCRENNLHPGSFYSKRGNKGYYLI
jgi:hypothetical protein